MAKAPTRMSEKFHRILITKSVLEPGRRLTFGLSP